MNGSRNADGAVAPRRLLALLALALVFSPTAASPALSAPACDGGSAGAMDPQALQFECLVHGEQALYGLVLMQPDGEITYRRNAEIPFVAASLYKLVLMADILALVDSGELAPESTVVLEERFIIPENGDDGYYGWDRIGTTTTVEEALFATGAYSSNLGAEALMSLTSTQQVIETSRSMGLTGTWFFARPDDIFQWPDRQPADALPGAHQRAYGFLQQYATSDGVIHVTTPLDIATFYRRLLEGTVVSPWVSSKISSILGQQVVRDRIPALLPDGTRVVHKTGNLPSVIHDAGIIYTETGPVILVLMAQDAADWLRTTEVEQRLAVAAYGGLPVPAFSS